MITDWEHNRQILNHGYLSNEFILFLRDFNFHLGSEKFTNYDFEDYIIKKFFKLSTKKNDFEELIYSFKEEMSPLALLEGARFNNVGNDLLVYFKELIKELWLYRYNVEFILKEIEYNLNSFFKCYFDLFEVLNEEKDYSFNNLFKYIKKFSEIEDKAITLNKKISELPHKIIYI